VKPDETRVSQFDPSLGNLSLAFPSISTLDLDFDIATASFIALQSIDRFLATYNVTLLSLCFALFPCGSFCVCSLYVFRTATSNWSLSTRALMLWYSFVLSRVVKVLNSVSSLF
jgi:hypothetical protein